MHHRHITAEQDVWNGLFALLASAREAYLRNVVDSGKLYRRFVDDFINSHRYIDCDNVVCRNCHEMIIHIVRGILHDYQDCVREKFATESFSLDDCMELKRMYDTSEINSPAFAYDADPMATAASLSFECNFSKEQMAGIVSCANTYHLFCVPTVRMEDMEALFACKEGFRIRVNNIRHVAVLSTRCSKGRAYRHTGSPFLKEVDFWFPRMENGSRPLRACQLPCLRQESVPHLSFMLSGQ